MSNDDQDAAPSQPGAPPPEAGHVPPQAGPPRENRDDASAAGGRRGDGSRKGPKLRKVGEGPRAAPSSARPPETFSRAVAATRRPDARRAGSRPAVNEPARNEPA